MACSKNTIECVNLVAIILGLGLAIFSIVLLAATDIDVFSLVPDEAAFTVLGLGLLVLVISLFGCCGSLFQKPVLVCCYAFLAILVILLQILGITYTLLYVNGIQTIEPLDIWVGEIQGQVESSLADWALDEAKAQQWEDLQTSFQCCGVTLESTFEVTGSQSADLEDILTGATCTADAISNVSAIITDYNNTYSSEAEDDATEVLGENFFCSPALNSVIQEQTLYIGIIAGVLVLVQLVSFSSAINMLFCLSWENGGFAKYNYDEEEEGLLKANSESDTKNDPRGPAPIPDSFTNRVSKRFGFAPAGVLAASQGGDENAGLVNRMSRSFPMAMFGGLPPPNAAPGGGESGRPQAAPSFMNRLSSRLPPMGGLFQPRQPAGPPPGFEAPTAPASRGNGSNGPPQPPTPPSFMNRLSKSFKPPMPKFGGPPPVGGPGRSGAPPIAGPPSSSPPPTRSAFGGPPKSPPKAAAAAPSRPPMGGGGRGGLLAAIEGGARLKKTQVNDRSGPAQTGRVL